MDVAAPERRASKPDAECGSKGEALDVARAHLRWHAWRGDVGTVVPSRDAWPGWLQVRFDGCPMSHRLTDDEIESVDGQGA